MKHCSGHHCWCIQLYRLGQGQLDGSINITWWEQGAEQDNCPKSTRPAHQIGMVKKERKTLQILKYRLVLHPKTTCLVDRTSGI